MGGGFTAIAFLVIVALNLKVAAVGVGWLIAGMIVYAIYRRRQGLDLASTHKVAIPQPVVDHEAEYDSVLVHVGEDGYDEQLMATAIKLAARKRRGIHVLVTIPVPNALSIESPMPEQESAAGTIIEQARLQGGGRVSGHWEKIRAGQAGRRIIEEAQDMRASAVVMALPRRVNGASLFGKTLETVLAERPCRIVIESAPPPPGRRARRRGAAAERELAAPMSPPDASPALGRDGRARPRHPRAHDRGGRRRAGHRRAARAPVRPGGRRAPVGGAAPVSAPRRSRMRPLDPPAALRRGLGSPALFAIVQAFLAASLYFGLGLVVENALGLTWIIFLAAVAFYGLLVLSYVEGASLHQERGGVTVLARYAFNELWSFVAGWAILLDYLILIALAAFATTDYAAVFWDEFDGGIAELALAAVIIVAVADPQRARRRARGATSAPPCW